MEESKRNYWKMLAVSNIFMRYPKFNIKINNNSEDGVVAFDTFVRDKKSDFIILVSDKFGYNQPLDWDDLEKLKDRFLNRCRLNRDKYIFNEDTAIKEP